MKDALKDDLKIDLKEELKAIKILFFCRMTLWLIAAGVTAHWMRYSFKLYEMGFVDEHEYAVAFRPVFARGLIIAVVCIGISYLLRAISDKKKKKIKDCKY